MLWRYVNRSEQPQPLRDDLDELVQYVYQLRGEELHPYANAVISYAFERLGECWINICEGSGPWSMRWSVSSRTQLLKLSKNPDEYIPLGTEDFHETLQDAADFADGRQLHGVEAPDEEFPDPRALLQSLYDDSLGAYSEGENASEGDSYQEDGHQEGGSHLAGNSSTATASGDIVVQEVAPAVIYLSDDTEEYPSLQESSAGANRRLIQAPSTPQQPVQIKQESQSSMHGRAATHAHGSSDAAPASQQPVQVKQESPQDMQGRAATHVRAGPLLATSQPSVRVKQEEQAEVPSRAVAQLHARPELAVTPDRKRLRQAAGHTGIKVDPDQGSVQPDRPPTQVFIPVVKTELNSHQHAQQQQPSILCDCGVPGAFCHAAGCTALYCRPCDRKKKAEDPCKGFVSCSLACCKRTKCCEQHRNMLRLCSQCDELCCKRATCPCCSNVFCNQCIGGHATPGCAA